MNSKDNLPTDPNAYGGLVLQPGDLDADPNLAGKYAGSQGYTVSSDFRVSQASGCRGKGGLIPHIGIQDYFGNSTDTSKSMGADEEEPGVSKVHSFRFFGR